MRVIIEEQTHSMRREMLILCLLVASGLLTLLVLLLPAG
jgi:hypothetical protein